MFALFAYNTFSQPTVQNHGPRVYYPTYAEVDESLQSYIKLTSPGRITRSGGIDDGWIFLSGTVSWIGSPQGSVKSLNNIHLTMYTRVDDRTYVNGTLTSLTIGSHILASPNKPTLPNDTIDHVEVIIPALGLDTPQYQYSLNCSTAINDLGDA